MNKPNYTTSTWEKWHTHGEVSKVLKDVRSLNNEVCQAEYVNKITNIQTADTFSILEIGPADGGMALNLLLDHNSKIHNYTVVDAQSMLTPCSVTLAKYKQVNYIPIKDVLTIADTSFDLLIANHCLEETPVHYQHMIYKTFFPNVNEVFLLCSTGITGFPGDEWVFDQKHLESELQNNFSTVEILPGHRLSRDHQKVFYGKK